MHLPSLFLFITFLSSVFAAVLPPTTTTNETLVPSLVRRYDRADATHASQIKKWMGSVNKPHDKLVFYTGPDGLTWAHNFIVANPDFTYFAQLFGQGSGFSAAFGGADPYADIEIAVACSFAMAQYATGNTRVFNNANGTLPQNQGSLHNVCVHFLPWALYHSGNPARLRTHANRVHRIAKADSIWHTTEKPTLIDNVEVTAIFPMADGTTIPADHGADKKGSLMCEGSGPYNTKTGCESKCKNGIKAGTCFSNALAAGGFTWDCSNCYVSYPYIFRANHDTGAVLTNSCGAGMIGTRSLKWYISSSYNGIG